MANDVSAGPLRQPAVCHSRFALLRRMSFKVALFDQLGSAVGASGYRVTFPVLNTVLARWKLTLAV